MSRIWAVARHMIAEGIRMKIGLVFIGVIIVLLPIMPFAIVGDGVTLKSRVQSFLTYSLGTIGFLLSMLTVFLSCGSLANEIRGKQIFMVASKPIPRWHFFLGKWLGIAVLNGIILLAAGLAVWGFTWYLKSRPTTVAGDREALQFEVLNVRYAAKLQKPDWDKMVEAQMRRLREEGRLENVSITGEKDQREQIRQQVENQWHTLKPSEGREFQFGGLLVDREKPGYLHLHCKPVCASGQTSVTIKAIWQCGDPNDVNTITQAKVDEFVCDRYNSYPLPTWAVNTEGTLFIRFQNLDPEKSIAFEGDDNFELLYDIGTFHWNLFRALAIIWCRLGFLAVLGLLTSTFLSFPVACMGCMLVMLVASASGFLSEAIEASSVQFGGEDPLWIVGPVLRPIGTAFLWLVPDFSKFNPIDTVVSGRVVPLNWVLQSLAVLIFIKGLVLGALGCVILTKRELAQVVV